MENFTPNQNQPSNVPPAPTMTPPPGQTPAPHASNASLIGSIVVIIILLVGGLFVWAQQRPGDTLSEERETMENEGGDQSAEVEVSANDDINSLERELNSTEIESSGDFDYTFEQN